MRLLFVLSLLFSLAAPAFAAPATGPSSVTGAKPVALGMADTTHLTGGGSASVMFATEQDWIQAFLGVNHSENNFSFGVGGAYKFTVHGTRATGFHFGPGFSVGRANLGFASKFGVAIYGAAGGHFTLFDRLLLSVDGGPIFAFVDDVDFSVKPLGNLLGLSVHYVF